MVSQPLTLSQGCEILQELLRQKDIAGQLSHHVHLLISHRNIEIPQDITKTMDAKWVEPFGIYNQGSYAQCIYSSWFLCVNKHWTAQNDWFVNHGHQLFWHKHVDLISSIWAIAKQNHPESGCCQQNRLSFTAVAERIRDFHSLEKFW